MKKEYTSKKNIVKVQLEIKPVKNLKNMESKQQSEKIQIFIYWFGARYVF